MKRQEDKFENFIKNQLSSVDPNDTWNIPDDSNWDIIEAQLDDSERKRRSGFWWIFTSLFILAGMSWGIYDLLPSAAVDRTVSTNTIASTSNIQPSIDNTSSVDQASVTLVDNQQFQKTSLNTSISSAQSSAKAQAAIENKRSYDAVSAQSLGAGTSKKALRTDLAVDKSTSELAEEKVLIPQSELNTPSRDLVNIQSIVPRTISVASKINAIDLPNPQWIHSDEHLSTAITLYTQGINHFAPNTEIVSSDLSELVESEVIANDLNFELGVQVPINQNLFISSGLSYSQFDITTSYDVALIYEKATEQSNGIDLFNVYNHSLPTSTGNIGTQVVMARSALNAIHDQETLAYSLSHQQSVAYLGLPIGVGLKKSGFSVHTQLLNNWRFRHVVDHPTVISKHNVIEHHSSMATLTDSPSQSYYMGIRSSIAYDVALFNGLSMGLQSGLQSDLIGAYYLGKKRAIANYHVGLHLTYSL